MDQLCTVTGYYDGPREGLCTLGGAWHVFRSTWDEAAQDYADYFQLAPVPDDIAALFLEAWAIWQRWEAAFYAGSTTIESHPALPADKPRDDELKRITEGFLAATDWQIKRQMKVLEWLQSPFQAKPGPIASVEWVE